MYQIRYAKTCGLACKTISGINDRISDSESACLSIILIKRNLS